MLETLEFGSIMLWGALWNRMRFRKTVDGCIKDVEARLTIDVSKYVEW